MPRDRGHLVQIRRPGEPARSGPRQQAPRDARRGIVARHHQAEGRPPIEEAPRVPEILRRDRSGVEHQEAALARARRQILEVAGLHDVRAAERAENVREERQSRARAQHDRASSGRLVGLHRP